tara:strand:- start:2109 stop:3797 length:1689 start_codon:yes stop_codon:yes gene_type:complete
MVRRFLIFILLSVLVTMPNFAQESFDLNEVKYQRKSIASTKEVVVLSDERGLIDAGAVKAMLEPYIALSRFDRNRLPDSLSQLFLDAVYSTSNHTVDSIGRLVNDIYATEIQSLLMDPVIQKARIDQFKNQDVFSFEFGKGKSYSVTADDLEKLFSSSFFYVPYIKDVRFSKTYFKKKVDDNVKKMKRLAVSVDAGVVWYQIKILPDQSIRVEFVKNVVASSYKNMAKVVTYNDDAIINDLLSACLLQIGDQFSYQIKHMAVFKLRGRIDSTDDNSLELDLSKQDGVEVDDYFWIMEDYQAGNGYQSRPVGLSFISDFKDDYNQISLSKATQVFGDKHHVGSWVKESPRYGLSLKLNLGYFNGFQLDSRDSYFSNSYFFYDTISTAIGLDSTVSYLLSKSLLNIPYSQLFFDFNFSLAPISVDYGDLVGDSFSFITYFNSFYVGFRKLFWLNQVAYQPFFYIGSNNFSISDNGIFSFLDDTDQEDIVFELSQSVVKFGVSIEKMVSPYVLLNASIFKSIGFGDPSKEYTLNYNTYYSSTFEENASYSQLDWAGFSVGFRVFL